MDAMDSWRYYEFRFSRAYARAEVPADFLRNAHGSASKYQPTYILKSWCGFKDVTTPSHKVFQGCNASIKSTANIANANGTPVSSNAST